MALRFVRIDALAPCFGTRKLSTFGLPLSPALGSLPKSGSIRAGNPLLDPSRHLHRCIWIRLGELFGYCQYNLVRSSGASLPRVNKGLRPFTHDVLSVRHAQLRSQDIIYSQHGRISVPCHRPRRIQDRDMARTDAPDLLEHIPPVVVRPLDPLGDDARQFFVSNFPGLSSVAVVDFTVLDVPWFFFATTGFCEDSSRENAE